jgi:hypothetical protein
MKKYHLLRGAKRGFRMYAAVVLVAAFLFSMCPVYATDAGSSDPVGS